jgi:ABC-type sulfate/molybdate transport systems ATPase subunit
VFQDQAYEFHIEFVQKRNRTEAELKLTRHGMTIDDPLNSSGGGVIDVAAFALRVACLILAQPPRRKVLFLDEPFRFVSAEYRPAIEQLLQLLSQELEIQIVMVTHIADLVTEGTVIEL